MWEIWKCNGRFIQGDLVGKSKTEEAAVKKAKKEIVFSFHEKEKRKDEILIWLDGESHNPIGVIVKKLK